MVLLSGLSLLFSLLASAQEIRIREKASMEQVYGETQESEELMSMNDLGVDFGYMLYEASVTTDTEECELEIENVRDFATVYVDGKPVDRFTFTKDYYWMASNDPVNICDSRLFGFVPEDHIIGKAWRVWYSTHKGRLFQRVE